MQLKYRFEKKRIWTLVFGAINLFLFINCSGQFSAKRFSDAEITSASTSADCGEPTGQSPNSIDQAVEMINQLPKPLSVACFLSHLKKPLQIFAVDNVFSAQPSQGPDNPRIFLFNGNLVVSVVPLGPGRDVVEFSQLTSSSTSIKGEIAFPVKDKLESSAPYSRILYQGSKTNCSVCHDPEFRANEITTGEAYQSGILRPDPLRRVRQNVLWGTTQKCDPKKDPERCAILRAIFVDGQAQDQDFPAGPQ